MQVNFDLTYLQIATARRILADPAPLNRRWRS